MDNERAIKILIVEDEAITAMDIARMLESWGWQAVGTASSGGEAIELAFSLRPDVVLMDVQLQGVMDGIATAQRIQARFDVPVIYLTALSDEDTVKRALYSRPYGYIVKPITPQDLREAIMSALSRHGTRRGKGGR